MEDKTKNNVQGQQIESMVTKIVNINTYIVLTLNVSGLHELTKDRNFQGRSKMWPNCMLSTKKPTFKYKNP